MNDSQLSISGIGSQGIVNLGMGQTRNNKISITRNFGSIRKSNGSPLNPRISVRAAS